MKYNYKITKEDKEKACQEYLNGKSLNEVADIFAVNYTTVYNWLKSRGIKRRTNSESQRLKYGTTTNDSAFDDLTKEETAYWIGFILGDGSIHKNVISIALNKRDKQHCYNFMKFVKGSQKPIYYNNLVRVAINSPKLVARLKELGIGERKSHTATPPKELIYNSHFWRGVIDADGSLGIYKRKRNLLKEKVCLSLCGSQNTIESFALFVIHNNIKSKVKLRPMKSIYSIDYSCKPAVELIELLYKGNSISLERKQLIANRCFRYTT